MSQLKPFLRRALWETRRLAAVAETGVKRPCRDLVFIVGCGRSGTTLLGGLMSQHPDVFYLNEPRDRWTAMDARTDDIGLYAGNSARLQMAADNVTARCRRRATLIGAPLAGVLSGASVVVEKSPSNVFRLDWLDALFPGSRFIHIVRDGRDVVRSIVGLASANRYRIAPAAARNQWWGRRNVKKRLLLDMADGFDHGVAWSEDGAGCASDWTVAALEWTLSVEAGLAFERRFPDRIRTIRYEYLVDDCRAQMTDILSWCGLSVSGVASLCEMISPRHRVERAIPFEKIAPHVGARFAGLARRLGYPDPANPDVEPNRDPDPKRDTVAP